MYEANLQVSLNDEPWFKTYSSQVLTPVRSAHDVSWPRMPEVVHAEPAQSPLGVS